MTTTPIDIPIFHHTDETRSLSKMNLEFSMLDCEIRTGTFYVIHNTFPYRDTDGSEYTEIISGPNSYISPLSPDDIKELITTNSLNQITA